MNDDLLPFERSGVRSIARELADRLIAQHPSWVAHLRGRRAQDGEFDLWLDLASPTGDPARRLCVWTQGDDIGIGYGAWHTHPDLHGDPHADLIEVTVDLVGAVLRDELVLVEESGVVDGQEVEDAFGLDLREPDAILDYRTDPHRLDTARLLSWTGANDQPL